MHIISEKDKNNVLNIPDSIEKIFTYIKGIDSFDKFGKDIRTVDV